MKQIKLAFGIALVCACGGGDTTRVAESLRESNIWVPGQERRIDGSVWQDGAFNSPEAKEEFCVEYGDHPDAWFCSNTASHSQAWTSSEYHGVSLDNDGSCYGPESLPGTGDCGFPKKKEFRLVLETTGCFGGPPPPNGPSTLQEQAILEGVRNGALEWDNNGGIDVAMSGTPGSSGYMPVRIHCQYLTEGAFADGGLSGTMATVVGNAPVGPHSGKDQDDLRTIDGGFIGVNIAVMWEYIKECYPNPTIGNIKSWSRYTGTHEFGHVLGFAHFGSAGNANIMRSFRPSACSPSLSIDPRFDAALLRFDPDSSGVTIENDGLQFLSPQ